MAKPIQLSVTLNYDGTNYLTSQKKPKLVTFNADHIVNILPKTGGGTSVLVASVAWSGTRAFDVSESALQISTAMDASTSNPFKDVSPNITAFAGGGQASAVALPNYLNPIATVATNGDSVKLPAVGTSVALVRVVQNSGAKTLAIFPSTGEIIDANAANASVSVLSGVTAVYYCDGVKWYTVS